MFDFTDKESEAISSYLNSMQFESDYPDMAERLRVLKRVMETHERGKLPPKFQKYLSRYELGMYESG